MRCSGCLQPKATRCRTRSFVFVLSVSALERSCTMAASMPARFFLILRPSSTKAGIRQRCAHSSQASRMVGESTPLVRQEPEMSGCADNDDPHDEGPATAGRTGPVMPVRLRTASSAHHDIERRPRRTLAEGADEFSGCSLPVRELVAWIPAPRCDHGKNEDPALAEQFLINARIALADRLGHVCEVEFDWPTAARLEVYEQRPVLRAEHVARVWLAVQQLFRGAAVADRSSAAS